jgi:anaerobic C4-dicarboxylate transporter
LCDATCSSYENTSISYGPRRTFCQGEETMALSFSRGNQGSSLSSPDPQIQRRVSSPRFDAAYTAEYPHPTIPPSNKIDMSVQSLRAIVIYRILAATHQVHWQRSTE